MGIIFINLGHGQEKLQMFERILIFLWLKLKEIGKEIIAWTLLFFLVIAFLLLGLGIFYLLGWFICSIFPSFTKNILIQSSPTPSIYKIRIMVGFVSIFLIGAFCSLCCVIFYGCVNFSSWIRANWEEAGCIQRNKREG